jgi:outer membrane protein assembly factor BamE (lipoprotein component of BamABCDE complex)
MKKICILFLLLLGGCITQNRGKILDMDDIKKIDGGLTSKENAVRILGYPSFKSDFNKEKWVYYSYKTKKFLFMKPWFVEQKVLLVEFDKDGTFVKNITLYDIDSNEYEIATGNKTQEIEDNNVIKDILSNIGSFSGQ